MLYRQTNNMVEKLEMFFFLCNRYLSSRPFVSVELETCGKTKITSIIPIIQ